MIEDAPLFQTHSDTSRAAWVTLTTIRAEMQWPQSALLATDLLACVTALREERVVRTTPAWKAPFAVCLESEVML